MSNVLTKEARVMKWMIIIGVPLVVFFSFYFGFLYGLSFSNAQFEQGLEMENQTTRTLLLSILKNTARTGAAVPSASAPAAK